MSSIPNLPVNDNVYSANLGLALFSAPDEIIENFILIDAAIGAGSSVRINGTVIPNVNFVNSATVTFSVIGSNVSLTAVGGGGGSGTVTSFSSGNLSPLFTTSVAAPTTTPALSFTLSNAAQNSVFAGPASGGAGAPSYQTAPTFSAANLTNFPTFNQNTTGTAANLSGTPALPNGTTATTQTTGDNTAKLATDAFVNASIAAAVTGVSSVSNSDGTLTISPTTGAVVASLALGHANSWTGTQTFATITPTTISGAANFSGTPTFAAGAGLGTGTFSGNATFSGNIAFSGTPTFANPVALGSSTATTQAPGTNNTTLATTAFVTAAVSTGDSFSAITSGTNTQAAMVVSSGASIATSGSGTVEATQINAVVVTGTPTSGQVLTATSSIAAGWATPTTGTVTNFSAGTLSPLFTTSVATSTTTPSLTFILSNAAAGTVFGNPGASAGASYYTNAPVLGVTGTGGTLGSLGLIPNISSGAAVTIQNLGATTAYNFNLPTTVGSSGQVLTSQAGGSTSMTWTTPTTGTVTSVALTVPGVLFSVSGSPITTAGTLAFSLLTQTANTVFAGPVSGGAATPTFRALVAADLPAGTGTVTSVSFTGGLISVATATTTPALTVAGTSGGIPYFSSTSTWASSALLASGGVVLGGGAGAAPATNTQLVFGTSTLTIGLAGAGTGILALKGTTSGIVSITGQAAAGTYNFNLPITVGSAGQVLTSQAGGATAMTWTTPTTGTVTSVSFTGGLISVATPTTTPALTVAGTSGGIPYFSSASTWASSALLATNGVVLGGGAGAAPVTNANLVYTTPNLVIGSAGGTNGGISLNGTTSGTSTLAVNAVGNLTATSPSTLALTATGANTINLTANSQLDMVVYSAYVHVGSGMEIGWSSTAAASTSSDTGLSRIAAGVVGIGTGAAGSIAGNLELNRTNIAGADQAGTATITAAGTSIAVAYAANYAGTAAPVVVVTPTSDPIAAGVPVGYWVTATGSAGAWSGFQINIQTALVANVTFGYVVFGKA